MEQQATIESREQQLTNSTKLDQDSKAGQAIQEEEQRHCQNKGRTGQGEREREKGNRSYQDAKVRGHSGVQAELYKEVTDSEKEKKRKRKVLEIKDSKECIKEKKRAMGVKKKNRKNEEKQDSL